jgi:sortase A
MARTHRPLRITVILLFTLSLTALGFLHTDSVSSSAAPILKTGDVPVIDTTTTLAPTTTTPPAAAPRVKGGVVRPPANSYAPEPIVKIGQLEIPKIGLSTPIYHGITLRNIDLGPSHWPGTAMPGEVGNAVFAGHRVTHTHPFLHIDQLEVGDQVIFTLDSGGRYVYSVTGHEVVKPDALWIADQTSTPTATIFGCHPPHFATYRYVVHMSLVSQ